jgi:hypothetical protein
MANPIMLGGFRSGVGAVQAALFLFRSGVHMGRRLVVRVDAHSECNRPAAHLAVLDVLLPRNGAVDEHIEMFAAVRTLDRGCIHKI